MYWLRCKNKLYFYWTLFLLIKGQFYFIKINVLHCNMIVLCVAFFQIVEKAKMIQKSHLGAIEYLLTGLYSHKSSKKMHSNICNKLKKVLGQLKDWTTDILLLLIQKSHSVCPFCNHQLFLKIDMLLYNVCNYSFYFNASSSHALSSYATSSYANSVIFLQSVF